MRDKWRGEAVAARQVRRAIAKEGATAYPQSRAQDENDALPRPSDFAL